MNENDDDAQVTPISGARTPEDIGEFWDNHSLADYWDETHEAEFELRAERRRRVTLDPEVYSELEAEAREGCCQRLSQTCGSPNGYTPKLIRIDRPLISPLQTITDQKSVVVP